MSRRNRAVINMYTCIYIYIYIYIRDVETSCCLVLYLVKVIVAFPLLKVILAFSSLNGASLRSTCSIKSTSEIWTFVLLARALPRLETWRWKRILRKYQLYQLSRPSVLHPTECSDTEREGERERERVFHVDTDASFLPATTLSR